MSSLSFFFASFKCDITSVTVALFALFSFTHRFIYCITVRAKKSTRSQGFILPSKWGIGVVNCRVCLERCFSFTTVTLYTGEEFRNTLSCNGNSSVGCSHPVLSSIVWRLSPPSKCPLYLLYSTYFWKHFKAAFFILTLSFPFVFSCSWRASASASRGLLQTWLQVRNMMWHEISRKNAYCVLQ